MANGPQDRGLIQTELIKAFAGKLLLHPAVKLARGCCSAATACGHGLAVDTRAPLP